MQPAGRHTRASARSDPGARPRLARGLTLLEIAVVLAVLAVLGALAVPGMASYLRAERLLAAAELLVADIADARHEAAKRGHALHVEARAAGEGASPWCWSVATAAACPCGTAQGATEQACRLKTVPATDHPGVLLLQAQAVRLAPDGQADPVLAAVFAAGERQLQVHVSRFGRARICDPAARSRRVPKC